MESLLSQYGYTVRFRLRTIKKRRRVNGRARGFYEGEYVYLRVTTRDGERDIYLGSTWRAKRPRSSTSRVEKLRRRESSSSSTEGVEDGGRKISEPPFSVSQRRNGTRHFR